MEVADLITSQRRWGHTRCRKLLAQVPMSETKPLGSMTERQRLRLGELLRAAESGEWGRAERATPWVTDSLRRA